MVYKVKSAFLLVILLFLASCQSDISSIPDLPVHIDLNINTYKLEGYGNYLYIPKSTIEVDATGFGGILIFHALDDNYYAFDLACPKEANMDVRIGKPNLNFVCECPSCGEKYDIKDGLGVPTKNISKEGLKRYSVSIDSYNNLSVRN